MYKTIYCSWAPKTGESFYWLDEHFRISGFDPRQSPPKRETVLQHIHPEDRDRVRGDALQAVRERRDFAIEYRIVPPGGTVRHIQASGHPVFNEAGEIIEYVGMVVDVTGRKRLEEERERLAADRLNSVVLINHHVRNALQVIRSARYMPPENLEFADFLERAVTRIDWALREILPRLIATPDGEALKQDLQSGHKGKFEVLESGLASADRTDRKQADDALRESEERFQSVFREAGVGMVILSPQGSFLAANDTFCDYLGYTEEELLAKTAQSVTFHEDWPAFSKRLNEALSGDHSFRRVEKRCLHKQGSIIHTETTASLIRSSQGDPQYFIGEVLDITKRKESEETLSSVNQRLIHAQEQERIRIARELHDDISQRLALLAIRLAQFEQAPPVSQSDLLGQIRELQNEIGELATNVQNLSHELHSSKLEYLGLVAAIRSWCKEFSEKQRMQIQFETCDVPNYLPSEISLCLFRVLQEALHNAAKHSGVGHFEVQLEGTSDGIHLTVSDRGLGFDNDAARNGQGLGLTSMQERLKLVNGDLSIDSQSRRGTTIHARVPFNSSGKSLRAAG